MTTDKPSRNEDEYFVKQDAELMQPQRAEAEAAAREAERKSHYMKCPKDGHDLAVQQSTTACRSRPVPIATGCGSTPVSSTRSPTRTGPAC